MSKQKRDGRPEARLPKGFEDTGAHDLRATSSMLETIREVYERYGFEPLETPAIEYTDALGKFLPDQDRPNEGVFSFQDEDQQWLSLRYDLTAPLARYVAENFDRLPKPFRRYAWGPVWRNEKPGPGRFRQFMQFDADTVGTDSVAADAEICMLAADTLEALGLSGKYRVKVNNRKVLDGVMETVGLGGEQNAGRRLTVLRAIDKLDRLGAEGVRLLLGKGRKDESGDYTVGAGLDELQTAELMVLFDVPAMAEQAQSMQKVPTAAHGAGMEDVRSYENRRADGIIGGVGRTAQKSAPGLKGQSELREIWSLVSAAGYNDGRICIDPSVVRGLDYYTGPVFEAELTFEVKNEAGETVRFGSVGGGGRYDDLVARFTGQKVPATGFSIGVSRLQTALAQLDAGAKVPRGPVIVLVLDRGELPRYQKMAQALRSAGIRAEMYLGTAGMKAQMKYADRRDAPCVVIQGSDERSRGEVQIKDLIEGAKAAAAIKGHEEWKAQRPAQVSVDESRLVEAVRDVLARHQI